MIWSRFTPVLRLPSFHNPTLPLTQEWLADLSSDRYRPMLRLLEDADWQFLRQQRGFRPEIALRLRRQRVQLFRVYLNMLEADFRRLDAGLRLQNSAGALRRRLIFTWQFDSVRLRLLLYERGAGSVDATRLVRLVDAARTQLTGRSDGLERATA